MFITIKLLTHVISSKLGPTHMDNDVYRCVNLCPSVLVLHVVHVSLLHHP